MRTPDSSEDIDPEVRTDLPLRPPPEPPGDDEPEGHLEGLTALFLQALEARREGDVDKAGRLLRALLHKEPRLAEPHLELASLLLDTERPEEALEHAREAVRILDQGGQWTDDLPPHVLRALAWDTLGEALRQTADQDEVVFGDADRWQALMAEARMAFRTAAELDPENEHAQWSAFGMGPAPEAADVEEPEGEDVGDLVDLVHLAEGTPVLPEGLLDDEDDEERG
jgi:tetratricopeptide (TPR) repeat protein